MTATTQARQPAGVPVGGQFVTTTRTEPAVALSAAGPRILATVQRQEWVGDTAYPVGEPFDVDVTDLVAELTPEGRAKIADNDLGSDDLYRAAMDRGLVEEHSGPFEVQVERSLREYDRRVATERLTALANELNVDPADVDDAVRDVTDQMASDMVNATDGDVCDAQDEHYGEMDAHASAINNGGLPSQVEFLVEEIGPERTEMILRECAATAARNAALPRQRKPGR